MSENPKCDPAKGGCKHTWSLHRKKRAEPCKAMGCKCKGFVGPVPAAASSKS